VRIFYWEKSVKDVVLHHVIRAKGFTSVLTNVLPASLLYITISTCNIFLIFEHWIMNIWKKRIRKVNKFLDLRWKGCDFSLFFIFFLLFLNNFYYFRYNSKSDLWVGIFFYFYYFEFITYYYCVKSICLNKKKIKKLTFFSSYYE